MGLLDQLLTQLKSDGGSDLHFTTGLEPRMRRAGLVGTVEGQPILTRESAMRAMREITNEEQWTEFEKTGDLDFAYAIPGLARFRVNFFMQEHGPGAVMRIIPEKIVPLDKLGAPDTLYKLTDLTSGLVLVTGPTGSGKSTTLAGVINHINENQAKHIVTIEEPVEFVHQNQKSIFSHREVGHHTNSFANALRAVIRQDPDVVLVGEMRDYETISLAMTAAEMGALVFGTLHTNNAAKTIDRIIDAFPAAEQTQARTMLSESLQAVVSQLLLRTADGKGRCAVYEILLRTSGLPNLIREGNIPMIPSLIQAGKREGMQSMDDCLAGFVQSGKITREAALHVAMDKSRFESGAVR